MKRTFLEWFWVAMGVLYMIFARDSAAMLCCYLMSELISLRNKIDGIESKNNG